MKRAFYSNHVEFFLKQSENDILGELTRNNSSSLEDLQRNAWLEEIKILKNALSGVGTGDIIFEYTIPRIGKRIDAIYIINGFIFLMEFKVGSKEYTKHAIDQVTDYALDLQNFHKESHNRLLIPILIATKAPNIVFSCKEMKANILEVTICNQDNLKKSIESLISKQTINTLNAIDWINSPYSPTPTIIEAAQELYRGHSVIDISRSDATAKSLNQTTKAINKIIDDSKLKRRKSICFITGVPGAGKTLAGLNIANERHKFDENEHAIFLSGNKPLVDVLQEALARDECSRTGRKKSEAIMKAKSFIQIIHHFRDDALSTPEPPIEKVAIFDEAQRAWTQKMLSKFMSQKKGKQNFSMSEPEFLIRIMDRHIDWAVIICLIGGGQEINTGEAGLLEWFDSLKKDFSNWDVYISDKITDSEYIHEKKIEDITKGVNYKIIEELHLGVSLRSFRNENVARFIKSILDVEIETARNLCNLLKETYPIFITRDLEKAKETVRGWAKGTERFGIVASSGAKRIRSVGVWVQSKIEAENWFLNGPEDVRSSYFLEDAATEFDIQGLELDWTIMCWDANLRFTKNHFDYYAFKGSKWNSINIKESILYLKNSYRVLLTRARQGMVVFIPHGDASDKTRQPDFYDGTFRYLKDIGLREI